MLSLEREEPAPVRHAPSGFVPPAKIIPAEPAAPQTSEISPVTPATQTQPEDPELRAGILETARGKNFTVYCAVLDAGIYARGNDLVLDMKHRYCFEVLRSERYSAELAVIFPFYRNVIIRFRRSEHICQKITPFALNASEPVQKTSPPRKSGASAAEPPVHETLPPVPEEHEAASESSPAKSTPSAFGDILRGLREMGLNPEVISLKHDESAEPENDADETQDDLPQEDDDE